MIIKPEIIIADLDGTITDDSHRHHHWVIKDYDTYHAFACFDTVKKPVQLMLRYFRAQGYKVAIVTSRPDSMRQETEMWLDYNRVGYDMLQMRPPALATTPSPEFKKLVYEKWFHFYPILFVLEDRLDVIQMWKELNVTCLQVL